jgi:hypothetical protein
MGRALKLHHDFLSLVDDPLDRLASLAAGCDAHDLEYLLKAGDLSFRFGLMLLERRFQLWRLGGFRHFGQR